MFANTAYDEASWFGAYGLGDIGGIGSIDGDAYAFLSGGDPDCVAKPWKKGCQPPGTAPVQPSITGTGPNPIVTTVPTTEPNQCPPGMQYAPPPPGSGTGSCTGSIIPGGGTGPTAGSSGLDLGGIFGSLSPTTWLIIGGVVLFLVLKK